MDPVEISKGLYLIPGQRYKFYSERVEHSGIFTRKEDKEYVFSEVLVFLSIPWGAGDYETIEMDEKRFEGENICELVERDSKF